MSLARGLSPGSMLGGYRIVDTLGRGAMGVVYRAHDERLQREVAIKILPLDLSGDEKLLARFRREGRVEIRHPNVVSLLDAGEFEGYFHLVFEYVPGGSLQQKLKERGRFPAREAAKLGAAIARGLHAVHETGLVHRDLKPENVLLGLDGEPKLSDFGIVGAQGHSPAVSRALTKTGEILGTVAYLSPEQCDGKRVVTPRSDLYGLGALLYALLVGSPPFEGSSMEVLRKHLFVEPRPPSSSTTASGSAGERAEGVPPALDALVMRLLAKDPEERPESALAVAVELDAIVQGKGRARRRRVPLVAILGGGAVLFALAFLATWAFAPPPPAPAPPPPPPPTPREDASSLAARAERAGAAGKLDEAIALATRAIALDPRCARAWAERGLAKGCKNDFPGSIADLERACEVDPRRARGWSDLGNMRGLAGDWKGAIAALDKAIDLDPKDAEAWRRRSASKGNLMDDKGAIADLDRALELDPRSAFAWRGRGIAKGNSRDFSGAFADLAKALELEPDSALIYVERAIVHANEGDLVAALADAEHAVELDPKLVRAWHTRAQLKTKKGDEGGAIADYSRALELAPDDVPTLRARGARYLTRGKLALAVTDLAHAVQVDPKDVWAWTNLGIAYLGQGNRADAVAAASRAIELDPREPQAYATRGLARADLHDKAGIADLEHYLEVVPDSPQRGTLEARIAELRSRP